MVISAFPKVKAMPLYVSGVIFARLRKAVSVCKWPNSISTGLVSTEMGGLEESEGCRLAPVIDASKNRTATPFGGVSPIVRLIGTPLVTWTGLMEPPQAKRNPKVKTTATGKSIRFIENPPWTIPNRKFQTGTGGGSSRLFPHDDSGEKWLPEMPAEFDTEPGIFHGCCSVCRRC